MTPTDAAALLGRLKADGLVTQRRDGSLHLRSYGKDARLALNLIYDEWLAGQAPRTCPECGMVLPMSVSHETEAGYLCATDAALRGPTPVTKER